MVVPLPVGSGGAKAEEQRQQLVGGRRGGVGEGGRAFHQT